MSKLFKEDLTEENIDLINHWVEELESGGREQVQGQLRDKVDDTYGYCCLGVLCDISDLGTWDESNNFSCAHPNNDQLEQVKVGELPDAVIEAVGFSSSYGLSNTIGEYYTDSSTNNLAALNDCGFSFTQIASIIKRELKLVTGES